MSAPEKQLEFSEEQINEIVELAIPMIEEELDKLRKESSSPEKDGGNNE